MKYRYSLIYPSGNLTAIVEQMVNDNQLRKEINNQVIKTNPKVEQVAFVNKKSNEFCMAGLELSINGLRSGIFTLLDGKDGEIEFTDIGLNQKFYSGLKDGVVWVRLDVSQEIIDYEWVSKEILMVNLRGISYLVVKDGVNFNKSNEEIEDLTMSYLKKYELLDKKAAGVIFYKKDINKLEILPVVWIRDMETLTIETACGSGSLAMGIRMVLESGEGVKRKIWQPSGEYLDVRIEFDSKGFGMGSVGGMVKKVREGEI